MNPDFSRKNDLKLVCFQPGRSFQGLLGQIYCKVLQALVSTSFNPNSRLISREHLALPGQHVWFVSAAKSSDKTLSIEENKQADRSYCWSLNKRVYSVLLWISLGDVLTFVF